jgi:5'-nucleotidase
MLYLVDCNDVLADFRKGVLDEFKRRHPDKSYGAAEGRKSILLEDDYPKKSRHLLEDILFSKGLHRNLGVIDGCVEGINYLAKKAEVRICTAPMPKNKHFMQEMCDWIEEKLGEVWASKRTITTLDKTLVIGDFLIDDKPQTGLIELPFWEHIVFGQPYNRRIKGKRISWTEGPFYYKEVLGLE